MGPTISSCRRPTLKWDGDPCQNLFVVCRFAFALIHDIQLTDVTTNRNVEAGFLLKDETLYGLILSADTCPSAMAFTFSAAFAD